MALHNMHEINGFGLCHIRKEGAAAHPDDYGMGDNESISDDRYLSQLKAYAALYGVENTRKEGCVRSHLLSKLDKKYQNN